MRGNQTQGRLGDILGVPEIPYKSFRNSQFHAMNYGAGKAVVKKVFERNVEIKIEIIYSFVDYLIDQGMSVLV